VALLLRSFPEIKNFIEELVFMGGAWGRGNVTSAAEFNIYADPEAAAVVMGSGLKIAMTPLEITL